MFDWFNFDWLAYIFCFLNNILVRSISVILSWLPSTPQRFQVSSMLHTFDAAVPLLGASVMNDIIQCVAFWLAVLALIKFWKLLPFT